MFDWIPRKLRYVLAASLVLSIAAPTGLSHDTVIVGHTVFKDANGYDPCLASIAGIARFQVLWFNDQVLTETNPEGGWIYATQAGAKSPIDRTIYGDGVVYEFDDPNGNHWVVLQGYYYTNLGTETGPVKTNTDPDNPGDTDVSGGAWVNTTQEYVWLVEIGPTYTNNHHGAVEHEFYNFVTIIDTCKFGIEPEGNESHDANDPYHPPGEDAHEHEVYAVDLYLAGDPNFVPIGANSTEPRIYSETLHNTGVET